MTELERLTASLAQTYRLERELGKGGMATVYLGEDLRHQRRVAVKVLRPDLSAIVGADRFLNEIRVTANLQHPHILPLYDSGSADGLLFYVMPYVQGESLRDRLNREKQLPIDEAVRLAKEVASALDYAHRQGVIHRDIKPENIMLQDGTALVTDFGIALAVSQAGGTRMTETGLSLGTPYYMSPEQATGDRQIDARSDIYALGAVLYEMLSGDPPHTGSTAQAIIAAVVTEEPRDIATRRPRLAPHVAEAVHRALEKLPADRFASAGEFAKALEGPTATTGRFASAPSARRAGRWRWAPAPLLLAGTRASGWWRAGCCSTAPALRETRTRLTFTGDASGPAVTPDGHWLAYIRGACRVVGSSLSCNGDVVVQELPRGVPSVIVDSAIGIKLADLESGRREPAHHDASRGRRDGPLRGPTRRRGRAQGGGRRRDLRLRRRPDGRGRAARRVRAATGGHRVGPGPRQHRARQRTLGREQPQLQPRGRPHRLRRLPGERLLPGDRRPARAHPGLAQRDAGWRRLGPGRPPPHRLRDRRPVGRAHGAHRREPLGAFQRPPRRVRRGFAP